MRFNVARIFDLLHATRVWPCFKAAKIGAQRPWQEIIGQATLGKFPYFDRSDSEHLLFSIHSRVCLILLTFKIVCTIFTFNSNNAGNKLRPRFLKKYSVIKAVSVSSIQLSFINCITIGTKLPLSVPFKPIDTIY